MTSNLILLSDLPDDVELEWEDRSRYRTKHRGVDLKLVCDNWPVKWSSTCGNNATLAGSYTHVSKASSKLQKKYKRAVQVHRAAWFGMLNDIKPDEQRSEETLALCEKAINNLHQTIPKINGKILVDIPTDVRTSTTSWDNLARRSISMSVYWTILTLQTHLLLLLHNDRGVIESATEALSIFPPISDVNPIPHPMEIHFVMWIAEANAELGNLEYAVALYRCCAAAKRLIHFYKERYDSGDVELMHKTCQDMEENVLRFAASEKIQQGATRPFFDIPALDMYEKELGTGIYSSKSYICSSCGVVRDEKKLNLCSGCRHTWYCSKECQRSDWDSHKSSCKGRWRKIPFGVGRSHEPKIRRKVAEEPWGITTLTSFGNQMILCCIDPDTDEVFDAWSDRPLFDSTNESATQA